MGYNLDGFLSLTIDDGWKNTYTEAFPLLKKYHVPATVFLTTEFIGTENPIWFSALNRIFEVCRTNQTIKYDLLEDNILYGFPSDLVGEFIQYIIDLDQLNATSLLKNIDSSVVEKIIAVWSNICNCYKSDFINKDAWLSWDDIYEMQDSGLVEFGPHGSRHYFFTNISDEAIVNEITSSWDKIDTMLNSKIKCFCYPGGLYSTKHFKCLEKAHMEFAITFSGGKLTKEIHHFQIPRNGVNWKSCSNACKLYNLVECVPGFYKKYPVSCV